MRYQKDDRVRLRHNGKVGRVLVDNRDEPGCHALVWVALDHLQKDDGLGKILCNGEFVHSALPFTGAQLEPE
ncbi:hypothetical protein [Polyangium mundeleinium]|uniref:DUF2158 domain-containing protein n=1 Tax=Polyangium mundeleinium TaxID=2995306 RepID=A0ABT5EZ70_9BACT|nr:hypothetical protein [Polyangium mundeleinium]MDC0746694.1 hypothetical protein [Polyangium mundeleinium]